MSDKKNTRYTIDIRPESSARLADMAKTSKLTQGEVIEVLLERCERDLGLISAFHEKRHLKVESRERAKAERANLRELYQKLGTLTPEQLAQIERITQEEKK